MSCAAAVPVLKFVGTVSLGLLTGVSYTVSTLALPALHRIPSASSAAAALNNLTISLKTPILALSTLASAPLLLSYVLSSRASRHPYLIYTSLLAVLSAAAPPFLTQSSHRPAAQQAPKKPAAVPRPRAMEASYEVLGDVHAEEAPSEEDIDEINGEEVHFEVESAARTFLVRTGIAALGFAMAVVGIWGDGAPGAVVYIS